MAAKQLSDKDPEGTKLGQSSTDLIGFYGRAPIAQPSYTGQTSVATGNITSVTVTATAITTTGVVAGFQSVAQVTAALTAINSLITEMTSVKTLANSLRAALVDTTGGLGLIAGN